MDQDPELRRRIERIRKLRLINSREYRKRTEQLEYERTHTTMQIDTQCDQCGGTIEQGEERRLYHGHTLCSGECLSLFREADNKRQGQQEVALARDRKTIFDQPFGTSPQIGLFGE